LSEARTFGTLRRHDRVRTRVSVRYGIGALDREDFAESVSVGGLYIRTNDVFRVGTHLTVEVAFPDGAIRRHGEVVWAIQAPAHLQHVMVVGMGISFQDRDARWTEAFERWRSSLASG
jgi:uncharacterized protein (TIGR02266 family)